MNNEFIHRESGASVTLSRCKDGRRIDKIFVPHESRGMGFGNLILDAVLLQADLERVTLYLVICADDDGPLCNFGLERWYRSKGFELEEGRYTYKRLPKCVDTFICESKLKQIGVIGLNAKRVKFMGRLKTPTH